MMRDIQITVENLPNKETGIDDDWDPMREEYENDDLNCYDHGPGRDLDVNLQRPAYRNKNNQPVYKIMVNKIPRGLNEEGLANLFMRFGVPHISKCFKEAPDNIIWALIEFKTLQEAQNSIRALDGSLPYKMRVSFARSDEENLRLKKQKAHEEQLYQQMIASNSNNVSHFAPVQNDRPGVPNRQLLRILGRGQNRGKFIINAYRQYNESGAGVRNCAWSNGIPDIRVPGGLMYDPRSNRHESSNRYLQKMVITTGANSVRKVSMGRAYIPPDNHGGFIPLSGHEFKRSIGDDVCVALLACKKCGEQTIQKCSQCGTPYCSRQCQRDDFVRHKPQCYPKESIDFDVELQSTSNVMPLSQSTEPVQPVQSIPSPRVDRFWGKPEKNVVGLLTDGTSAIVTVTSEEPGKFHGVLGCREVFEVTQKLIQILPCSLRDALQNTTFWPPVGTLVAVRYEGSVWRGYILNAPIIGSSTSFVIALCDRAKIARIEVGDLLPLPSDYLCLPDMAVTCTLLQTSPELEALLEKNRSELSLKIESASKAQAHAQVLGDNGEVVGKVLVTPWEPQVENELLPVQMSAPCHVTMSAYHHQHAIYVKPFGKIYQEQMFNILQKVAAVVVTTPPLQRAPVKGEMVACQYKDGNYYRAIVQEEKSAAEYSVFFVDFGNIDSAAVSHMKALPVEIKMSPCMAVKVSLKGVKQGPLTEAAVQFLNMVVQKEQQLRLEWPNPSVEGVDLFLPDNRSFNSQLNEFLQPDWEHSMKKGLEPHRGEVFMSDNLDVLPLIKGGMKGFTNVVLLCVMEDARLAVCPLDCPEVEHVVQTLSCQISEYCESLDENTSYNPRVGEVCLARYNKDGMWYRAVNFKTVVETQSCEVLFLDYGNIDQVEFKAIRRMVPDFVTTPTIMSICSIDGLAESITDRAIEKNVVKRLNELLTISKVYEVEVLDSMGKGEYKISIPEVSNQLRSEFSS